MDSSTSVPDSQGVANQAVATIPSGRGGDSSRRARARNWNPREMLCLAEGKKLEQERDMVNAGQNRFMSSAQKWKVISDHMIARGRSPDVCTIKWNNLFGDYKAIKDYQKSSGSGDYFSLSKNEKLAAKLVSSFSRELYNYLDGFCNQRPCMGPASAFDSGGVPSNSSTGGHPKSTSMPSITSTHHSGSSSLGNEVPPTSDATLTPQMHQADHLPRQSSNSDQSLESEPERPPGDRAPGSTGRAKRKRNTVDVAGVLRSSHEGLIHSLDKQSTQRALMFEQQVQLEKEKFELDKLKEEARAREVSALAEERRREVLALAEERRIERQAVAEDRRALVTVFKDFAMAVNAVAARRPSGSES